MSRNCRTSSLYSRTAQHRTRTTAVGKVGEVKLDIRHLLARDVVAIAISGERQTHQNVLKLKALSPQNWSALVDLIETQGLQASDQDIGQLLGYQGTQIQTNTAEIGAARSNMFGIVRMLHD